MKNNALDKITDKIIKALENGSAPWIKPWSLWKSWSYGTGNDYSGINAVSLSGGEMITFKQCQAADGKVNKGAESQQVAFYKDYKSYIKGGNYRAGDIYEDDYGKHKVYIDEEGAYYMRRALKYYNVFSVKNDTDLEIKTEKALPSHEWDSVEQAENIFKSYTESENIPVKHGSNEAFNAQGFVTNKIVLPEREQFKSAAGFYGTAFHEAIHSTGKALNRNMSGAKGSKAYAREELIAEIGSAYIMSFLGMENNIENSANYCANWASVLKYDKAGIMYAAPKALEAAKYILSTAGLNPEA